MKKVQNKIMDLGKGLVRGVKNFWEDESGMGTVEVILIIVVLIGLVIVFKKEISDIVDDIFKAIRAETRAVTN